MGVHDRYGKEVLVAAVGSRYDDWSANSFSYGPDAGEARLDGTIDSEIAVEIESRTDKQIRGAILDLICHPYPKKLLVLIPAHQNSIERTRRQGEAILRRFGTVFQVVVLTGTGHTPNMADDAKLIRVVELRRPLNMVEKPSDVVLQHRPRYVLRDLCCGAGLQHLCDERGCQRRIHAFNAPTEKLLSARRFRDIGVVHPRALLWMRIEPEEAA